MVFTAHTQGPGSRRQRDVFCSLSFAQLQLWAWMLVTSAFLSSRVHGTMASHFLPTARDDKSVRFGQVNARAAQFAERKIRRAKHIIAQTSLQLALTVHELDQTRSISK